MQDVAADPYGLERAAQTRDPYPAYARLRAEAPVHESAFWGGYLVTRHADVAAGFRDPALSASRISAYGRGLSPEVRERIAPLLRNFSFWTLFMDPPAHTRIRGLIARAFTPRIVESLSPRIEAVVESLLDAVGTRPGFDAIEELSAPLPVTVIGELLGLPRADDARLKHWSDALGAFLGAPRLSQERLASAVQGVQEMEAYFRQAIDERRRRPGDDLLSMLCAAHDEEGRLDEQELVSTACMLLFGGHETTTNLIGNGLHLLLHHPAQADILRARPSALEGAVEEILRYEAPTQRQGRLAREDVEIAGVRIPAGSRVWLVMGAANRDAAEFSNADQFDVLRPGGRHFSFGFGAHFCIGAALGRLEAKIALGAVLRRFPRLALSAEAREAPQWLDNLTIRGLSRLPLLAEG
jgi:hypothetical protein